MHRLALALAIVFATSLPAAAQIGDTLVMCKRRCDQPGVHHVRVFLDHGKVVQEAWWLDLEETETWKLDRIRDLRDTIAGSHKVVKEWRAGEGIDDNLLANYDNGVGAGVFFEGEGQTQSISVVSPFFNPEAEEGVRDVTIEVAYNRTRRPRRESFERRLAHAVTLADDLTAPVPAGTTAVRLAVPWARFALAADPYTLDVAALERVDVAIARLRQQGLAVLLSYAGDEALCIDPAAARKRFLATWRQLGKHFGEVDANVAFELYHHPTGKLAEAATWASICEDGLEELRNNGSSDATVLVAPPAGGLAELQLPPDDGLLVTVPAIDAAAGAWAAANDVHIVALP